MLFDQSININQYILLVDEEPSIEAFRKLFGTIMHTIDVVFRGEKQ